MKRISALFFVSLLGLTAMAQKAKPENTLLWKISGNGLEKPSYLYGTIHMICADDAILSVNLKKAIRDCDEVFFEVDMDNLFEMLGAMAQMKMKGDTTLRDLLSEEEYARVKQYFEKKGSLLPFSMLETYKPILAASTLEGGSLPCGQTAVMEQVIMEEARGRDKKISGLETMGYQAGVLDSIPYSLQARQLLGYIDSAGKDGGGSEQLNALFDAYKKQDLARLEDLMKDTDLGMSAFTDILLYHRNQNWVKKLRDLLPKKSLVVAVGAGHLPGEKGVIALLRAAGYTVTPVENKLVRNEEI